MKLTVPGSRSAREMTGASRYVLAKAILDRMLASVLLVMFSPVILVVLLLVRITSAGPLIYRLKRVGQNGSQFLMYRIRSTYVDSQTNGPSWSLAGHRRVAPIGRFLRGATLTTCLS